MANLGERARDWWEGKAPRERRLLAALGATLVICVLAWVAMTIRGGLASIEAKNQKTRDALRAVDLHRMVAQSKAEDTPKVEIPETEVDLASYLDEIITAVGLKSPTYPSTKKAQKGDFTESSFHISLSDLNITQLEQLLAQIETKNRAVVVTELKVSHPNYRDQDKLDVEMTIAAYYKKPVAGKEGAAGAQGGATPPVGGVTEGKGI